jgi:hypothetical protein
MVVKEHKPAEGDLAPYLIFPVDLVDPNVVPVNYVWPWFTLESILDIFETVLEIEIIGVQPADDVSLRLLEPFVQGVALAAIRLRDPAEV